MTVLRSARLSAITTGLSGARDAILATQRNDGAIPWFADGPWDAWNHCESLMALTVTGETDAAAAALDHLAETQHADGCWTGEYGNALPMDAANRRLQRIATPAVRDTNFIAYPATAVWHAFLAAGDREIARRYWPMVRAAIGAVLRCQHRHGDVSWCVEAHGMPGDDAVLAGNASIFASLGHAILLGLAVGEHRRDWLVARNTLRTALCERAERFDRAGQDRSRFAMDWYYPVLAGALPQAEAQRRLIGGRRRFIEDGRGCRCVADEPWATVAESAELALALIRIGARDHATRLLDWQEAHRDADGAYWMGWQFALDMPWPLEKPSWTQAAMILARDALHGDTPAARVLTG